MSETNPFCPGTLSWYIFELSSGRESCTVVVTQRDTENGRMDYAVIACREDKAHV